MVFDWTVARGDAAISQPPDSASTEAAAFATINGWRIRQHHGCRANAMPGDPGR